MAAERVVIPGRVKGRVVVPDDQARLPEGTPVNIVVALADIAPELQPEFAHWDQAGDDAWAMIGEWEREEQP